jgi:3-oxoacyl-[acyl-carrier protein] reductase
MTYAKATAANGTVTNGTAANGTAANGIAANGTAANGTVAKVVAKGVAKVVIVTPPSIGYMADFLEEQLGTRFETIHCRCY